MHASYKTSSEILNGKFIFEGSGNIGDQLEARISSIEHIQEEFGHEIREIKKELARLATLMESRTKAKVVQPQEFSPSPT